MTTPPESPTNTTSESPEQKLRTITISISNVKVELCNLGASITRLLLPSHHPHSDNDHDDCVLGFDSPQSMKSSGNTPYFGVIVGRVANRIGNSTFKLNDQTYQLNSNNGRHHLHGGLKGFNQLIWGVEEVSSTNAIFSLVSDDGDEGYPGLVHARASYTLEALSSRGVVLRLEMTARLGDGQTVATPINLAQHSYFNLCRHDSANGILDHDLTIPAEMYTPTDEEHIPTGGTGYVEQTKCMDFRKEQRINEALDNYFLEETSLSLQKRRDLLENRHNDDSYTSGVAYGFDHNYILPELDTPNDKLKVAGILKHPPTGRKMTVMTNAPGVQLYTANYLDGTLEHCKDNSKYYRYQAVCLETQHVPDSIGNSNLENRACFILQPGSRPYHHIVEYHFEF